MVLWEPWLHCGDAVVMCRRRDGFGFVVSSRVQHGKFWSFQSMGLRVWELAKLGHFAPLRISV